MIALAETDRSGYWRGFNATTANAYAICLDLLRYEQIGEANTLRGRVVRAFFWLMRVWRP